jgi:Ca-activated chloride channel family protein
MVNHCACSALIAIVAAVALTAAQDQPPLRAGQRFRTGVEVIAATATVTDADGHLVTGLPRDAFEIFEDGIKQPITQFTNERVPVGVGVLVDISDSMFGQRIQDARSAVERFLFDLLSPDDEFFVLAFNHQPHVLTRWTRDAAVIRRALDSVRPFGGTAVYDAVIASLPLVRARSRERAALLVISDGADTASSATMRDVRSGLLRSDAFVYAIAIDSPDPQPINTRVNTAALRELTGESGGRTEVVQNSSDLAAAAERIANELNSQYVIGYNSTRAADGQFHSIRVRATDSAFHVRARNGYVATAEK